MFRSEREFLQWVSHRVPRPPDRPRHAVLGIGDDAALVRVQSRYDAILTTDMSIEGVHFIRELHPARAIGHRALARSLSDIAAMGGIPRYALVSLALPKRSARAWTRDLYEGMLALAGQHDVSLVGGDTAVVSGPAFIDVLVAGEVPRGKALLRSGARPGDGIFVSGTLGLSALGLRALRLRRANRGPEMVRAIQAHLYPEPQCLLGLYLSRRKLANSLMDISDGLSIDLHRLAEASGVGARLWADRIPGPALKNAEDSLELALHGGEDYQLLFTVSPDCVSQVPRAFRGLPLRCIGEIKKGKGVRLVGGNSRLQTLEPGGWDHFRKGSDG